VSIGRPRCPASAWPSAFPSDGRRVGLGAPTARFENSHEKMVGTPRLGNSRGREVRREGPANALGEEPLDTICGLQLPRFSAGEPGTAPSGAGGKPLTDYANGL
jgi:hypothetical protein